METTAQKPKKSSKRLQIPETTLNIRASYVTYLLTHGARPPSVYKFCVDLAITEDRFYEEYGSFDSIEKAVWRDFILTTIDRLNADTQYHAFSSREKILAFYFTLFEELKQSR